MSVLNTDLVYGSDATHLVHYMHQCAIAGKINAAFHDDSAKFMPVHHADLTRAVSKAMESGSKGQFALRGSSEVTIRELLSLIENSCGIEEGKTGARFEMPILPLTRMLEEFLVGTAADTNMAEMITHFSENQGEKAVNGESFWEAAGVSQEADLRQFFNTHRVSEEDEHLLLPTFGGYKFPTAD